MTEIPLGVYQDLDEAETSGFWQSISTDKDKQLVGQIAAKITCNHKERICREADASMLMGIMEAQLTEYEVSSWTTSGIVADEDDECNRHTLTMDFKGNTVTVTDYPIKNSSKDSPSCKPLHDAYSYALHGGQLQLYPPAPWDESALKKLQQETK